MAEIATYAVPQSLYRFRRLNGVDGSLLEQELAAIREGYVFCPTYASMNDPLEGNHTESAVLSADANHAETIKKVTAAKASLGIASFSEVVDHEPMWAHYADGFTGICVRYNFKKLLRCLDDDSEFVRMAYSEIAPMLFRDRKTAKERAKLVLSTKTVRWASEREWRLMRPKSGKAPYKTLDCVSRIYLGSRIKDSDRDAVIALAKQLGVEVHAMELDHYSIKFKRVPETVKLKKARKPKPSSLKAPSRPPAPTKPKKPVKRPTIAR